jgi:hypothetical protein
VPPSGIALEDATSVRPHGWNGKENEARAAQAARTAAHGPLAAVAVTHRQDRRRVALETVASHPAVGRPGGHPNPSVAGPGVRSHRGRGKVRTVQVAPWSGPESDPAKPAVDYHHRQQGQGYQDRSVGVYLNPDPRADTTAAASRRQASAEPSSERRARGGPPPAVQGPVKQSTSPRGGGSSPRRWQRAQALVPPPAAAPPTHRDRQRPQRSLSVSHG